jgi:hypothetical protein
MTEPVKVPVQIAYDGTGFKQLSRDAQRAQREALAATRQQIQAQRNLSRLTSSLDRSLARDTAGRGPSLAQQIGGQFVAANVLQDVTQGIKEFTVTSIQSAMAAERLGTATEAMGRRFGVSGKQIVESIQAASLGTINEMDAMRAANQAMLLGVVKSEEEFAELAKLGIVLGRAMGQDAKKSIEDITIGIGRQSRLILDNLGILVDAEKAYADYAAAIGKSTDELTDAEKTEAFRQEVLEQGRAKVKELGDVTLDAAGQVEQLTASWQDFQAAFGGVIIQIGQASGGTGGISGFVDKLTEGANAWEGFFKNVQLVNTALQDLNKGTILGQVEQVPLFGNFVKLGDVAGSLIFRSEELGESFSEAGEKIWGATDATTENTDATNDNTAATDENAKAQEKAARELERRQRIMKDATREMIAIEEQAAADITRVHQDFNDDVGELNEDTWDRIEKAQADSAKRQKQIQKDLKKDLLQVDRDLAKDLEKAQADIAKRNRRQQEDNDRAERREKRQNQIDALADERLFEFELRQMGAEGDAIGIQQALERRAIEEEIARERGQAEQQIEDEDRRIEQQRQQEDDAERLAEMRAAAEERKAQIEEAALEQAELERESLKEQIAAENEAYDERLAELEQFRDDKLAEIQAGKEEAIQELAEELATAEELTNSELNSIAAAAGKIGKDTGVNFAKGLADGIRSVQGINDLLGIDAPADQTGAAASSAFATDRVPQFASGGVVPGPIGQPRFVIAHGGETITPAGRGGATVNFDLRGANFGNIATRDEVIAAFQEYTNNVLGPALAG